MEVKKSITGQKRYPREFKRLVVEKRRNENWSWRKTAQWVEEDYGIKIPNGTFKPWSRWYEEYIEGRAGESSSKAGNRSTKSKNWQPEEDEILIMCVEASLTGAQTAEFMNDTPELNFRTYTTESIYSRKRKLPELLRTKKNPLSQSTIKECKKLLSEKEITLVEYINTHAVKVQCDSCNHIWKSSTRAIKQHCGCPKCSTSFAGGLPSEDDCRDALVYLIYTEEIDKLKVGYTTGKGIEAIKKRFIIWPIPYEYKIIAYDQSTAGLASRHEQWLLKNTKEHQTFEQGGEIKFDGYTEFRNKNILNELLPHYETVLDMAFKI
jgi:hypothetical protein